MNKANHHIYGLQNALVFQGGQGKFSYAIFAPVWSFSNNVAGFFRCAERVSFWSGFFLSGVTVAVFFCQHIDVGESVAQKIVFSFLGSYGCCRNGIPRRGLSLPLCANAGLNPKVDEISRHIRLRDRVRKRARARNSSQSFLGKPSRIHLWRKQSPRQQRHTKTAGSRFCRCWTAWELRAEWRTLSPNHQ